MNSVKTKLSLDFWIKETKNLLKIEKDEEVYQSLSLIDQLSAKVYY